jgi:hypothetical protein
VAIFVAEINGKTHENMEANNYTPPQCEVVILQLEGAIATGSETNFDGFKDELFW